MPVRFHAFAIIVDHNMQGHRKKGDCCVTCNVSFCLEMDSDYVISKSEGHLALLFLQFCKKYDICTVNLVA